MVGAGVVFLGGLVLFGAGAGLARAEPARSCESVCEASGMVAPQSIQRQWDQLFRSKRVCRIEGGISKVEAPSKWIEDHRDPLTGARMVAAIWTGGCQMNRPVKEEFRESVDQEGSQGLIRHSLESVGLQYRPECIKELPLGAPLQAGDILRLGRQSMIVASVGEDPFGIVERLDPSKSGLNAGSARKAPAMARQHCREWLMDTSKFQISVMFLSSGRGGAPRVRQGTFGSVLGEDHPGSRWDQALQDWAIPACIQKIMGRVSQPSGVDSSPLKVERVSTAPGCRAPSTLQTRSRDHECALCCLSGRREP